MKIDLKFLKKVKFNDGYSYCTRGNRTYCPLGAMEAAAGYDRFGRESWTRKQSIRANKRIKKYEEKLPKEFHNKMKVLEHALQHKDMTNKQIRKELIKLAKQYFKT